MDLVSLREATNRLIFDSRKIFDEASDVDSSMVQRLREYRKEVSSFGSVGQGFSEEVPDLFKGRCVGAIKDLEGVVAGVDREIQKLKKDYWFSFLEQGQIVDPQSVDRAFNIFKTVLHTVNQHLETLITYTQFSVSSYSEEQMKSLTSDVNSQLCFVGICDPPDNLEILPLDSCLASNRIFGHILYFPPVLGEKLGLPIVVLTFRGTDPTDLYDIFHDFDFRPKEFNIQENNFTFTGRAHSGFQSLAESDWKQINVCLKKTLKVHISKSRVKGVDYDKISNGLLSEGNYLLFGHSLGGAESQLVGLYIYPQLVNQGKIFIMSLSSPPVFDRETAGRIKSLERIFHQRFFGTSDIIPKVSFFLYEHSGLGIPLRLSLVESVAWTGIQHHRTKHITAEFLELKKLLVEGRDELLNNGPVWTRAEAKSFSEKVWKHEGWLFFEES